MGFARIDGLTMHYRVAGPADGPVLVLANSLGTDARIWDPLIALLSDRYRIVSYDKRGHGLSDVGAAPYTLDALVGDLAGLLQHLRIDTCALAGVSVGGLIAQRFALLHPQRLTALMLCDTAAKVGTADLWNARIDAVKTKGIAAISNAILERWFTAVFRENRPAEFSGWRNLLERTPPEGYAGTCAALRDADLRNEVGSIGLKTLVVCGAEDKSTPPELVRQTAQMLPDARFEVIEGAGHIPSIEQPERLAALMRQYFEEVGHV